MTDWSVARVSDPLFLTHSTLIDPAQKCLLKSMKINENHRKINENQYKITIYAEKWFLKQKLLGNGRFPYFWMKYGNINCTRDGRYAAPKVVFFGKTNFPNFRKMSKNRKMFAIFRKMYIFRKWWFSRKLCFFSKISKFWDFFKIFKKKRFLYFTKFSIFAVVFFVKSLIPSS